jgi:hypothetical protein
MPLTWIHNFGKAVCKAPFACEDMLRLKQIQNPDVNTVYLQTNCRITPVFHTRIILWKTGRNCKHHAILSKIRKTLIEPRFTIQIWLLRIPCEQSITSQGTVFWEAPYRQADFPWQVLFACVYGKVNKDWQFFLAMQGPLALFQN